MFGNLYINNFYTFGLNHLDRPATGKTFITNIPSRLGGQNAGGSVLQTFSILFKAITKINITLNISKSEFWL